MSEGNELQETKEAGEPQEPGEAKGPRIGVFICSCGTNVADFVDVEAVTEYASTLPHVVFTRNNLTAARKRVSTP